MPLTATLIVLYAIYPSLIFIALCRRKSALIVACIILNITYFWFVKSSSMYEYIYIYKSELTYKYLYVTGKPRFYYLHFSKITNIKFIEPRTYIPNFELFQIYIITLTELIGV